MTTNTTNPNAAEPETTDTPRRSRAHSDGAPVAVITGASRGLGRALAHELAHAGWRLVLTARSESDLSRVAAELAALTEVAAIPGSVVDDDHRAELAHAAAEFGGADLLVNNASTLAGFDLEGAPMPTLGQFPLVGLLETFEVNVLGPIALTQLVLPQLRRKRGRVLNISSDAAIDAYAGWGGYGASKAALDHASAILAVEEPALAVWSVDPGDMRTRMHAEAFPGEDISDRALPETVVPAFRRLLDESLPSGRYRAADLLKEEA